MTKPLKGSNKKGVKFPNGHAYVVLTSGQANATKLNLSNSLALATARKNNNGTKYILEILEPIPSEFLTETLYSEQEIKTVLQNAEWIPNTP